VGEIVKVPPDVERIVEGLRDTGYEFNTAVADVIDNSIAAGATSVDVRVAVDFVGQVLVSIGDNGCGMDRDGLINAMKYGSKRRSSAASLGKFGLGLKTASTAFCRRLVVVSRDSDNGVPLKAAWDLDALAESDEWGLELAEATANEVALLNEVAPEHSGTVVIWEKADRIVPEYKKPDGKAIKNAVKRLETLLVDHVAMIYQRFLDSTDSRARNVAINVNGKAVQAWDPFCVEEVKGPAIEQVVRVKRPNGDEGTFTVRAFILPRKEEFSSEERRQRARISNDLQGVYVYRENRLIHGPDWLNMFKTEPHFSLLRVELSFAHDLDDAFQVDIKKSRILLNADLYDWLRDKFLAAPRREAETRARKGTASTAKGAAALLHKASNSVIGMRAASLATPKITASNPATGAVDIQNNAGFVQAKLHIAVPASPSAVHITTATTLDNGVLWEGSLTGGNIGVTLNAAHPYYLKAYLPNTSNSPLIQALDFLLWSLAQAELNNVSAETRDAFEEFRIEVSRNLKKLVADLPDAPEAGIE
jgi:hypothetical protein